MRTSVVVMVSLALLVAAQASASPIVLTGENGADDAAGNYGLGTKVTYTGSGDAITALGTFDKNNDGLAESHAVYLWTGTGTLLASVTVPAGTTATLVDGYRYLDLATPVTLTTGASYMISVQCGDLDPYKVASGGSPVSFDPTFTFGGAFYGSPDGFPTGAVGYVEYSPAYLGPNALFAPVPEPATMSLLALGGLGALIRRRK